MIKIIHVVHSLNEGGIERHLLELCGKIDREKFEIQVCCLVGRGNLTIEFERLGINVHFLNSKRDFGFLNSVINFYKLLSLSVILRREKINVTHGHEFYSTVFSRIAGLLGGVKFRYITLHNMYYWWPPIIHKIQRYLSCITTAIVCNSKATMEYSFKKDKIKKNKYRIIYLGIDCEKFKRVDIVKDKFCEDFNIPLDSYICMAVGNVSPRKGFEYLIKAAGKLKSDFNDMVYFIVGGQHHKETEEYEKLVSLIDELGLKNSVIITGRLSNVPGVLKYCDLFVMPSIVEGLGLSLIEALAMEKVAIASDIEPFKEIVDDNINGFFFKSGDYIDLAEKIKMIRKTDGVSLRDIRQNARKTVLEKFNSDRMVKEYEDLYGKSFT